MWKDAIEGDVEELLRLAATGRSRRTVEKLVGREVVLYGAGIDGLRVLDEVTRRGIRVRAIFDIRAAEIDYVPQLPVVMPGDPLIPEDERADIPVILTVKPFAPRNRAILRTLSENGYGNAIPATDLFDFYSFTDRDLEASDSLRSKLIQCAGLLEDEASYRVYTGFLRAHASREYDTFSPPSERTKYFDADIPRGKGWRRFVDCGAFDGDTLRDLNRIAGSVEAIAAFECDLPSFHRLASCVAEGRGAFAEQVFLFPCGVWSATTSLQAHMGMGLNSHIAQAGEGVIQCVALDEVLVGFDPTCIKLDVEGAESEALHGAREMIEASRPDLTISLYHDLRDMWELPLLVAGWDLGYRFHVRAYGPGGNATMLYAQAGAREA